MANCKLTKSLNNKACEYAVAGARALYLVNFYSPLEASITPEDPVPGRIVYVTDVDGNISSVTLPAGEYFYQIDGSPGTISFTDALLAGGNGGKYRQHTVNAVLNQFDEDLREQIDALSLGRFVAFVVDNAGRVVILGRTSGLTAAANGADYNSGAAEADATGWTLLLQGTSMESAPLAESEAVITPIEPVVVVPPGED